MLTSFRWRHHLRTLGFLTAIAAFAVIFPTCYMLELTGGAEGGEDTTASSTPGANLETVTFVHTNASSDASLTWVGFALKADFSGYDLGLVAPENRTSVAEHPRPAALAAHCAGPEARCHPRRRAQSQRGSRCCTGTRPLYQRQGPESPRCGTWCHRAGSWSLAPSSASLSALPQSSDAQRKLLSLALAESGSYARVSRLARSR